MISLRRTSTVSIATLLPQAERARLIAQAARRERDDLVRAGRAPASWRTFVDGREGAAEESIRPGGTIIYRFNLIGEAAEFALAFCQGRSPRSGPKHGSTALPGPYREHWFVLVDGHRWTGKLRDIPAGAEVWVANDQPYHRKIDIGGQIVNVPSGIIEDARRAVSRRFKAITAQRTMITLPGGYTLAGYQRSMAKAHAAHIRHAGTRTIVTSRKDSVAGQAMTYPALVLTTQTR